MKKAVLLLAMVTLVAGCIYLKNADKDTVLYEQQAEAVIPYSVSLTEEYTEETVTEETVQEEETPDSLPQQTVENASPQTFAQERESEQIAGVIFNKLAQNEQEVYLQILDALLAREEKATLSTTDSALIDKVFNCVMLEHPEIFYADGYKYTEYTRDDRVERIEFSGKYLYDAEEIGSRLVRIEEKADSILAGMPDTEDEYLKVKYLYDTLVAQTEYDIHSPDNQNICSVFLNGKSVCQGYAKAFQFLAKRAGMDCCLVLGDVIDGDGHAWNLISVNGAWYYLDATWGDAFYLFGNTEQALQTQASVINYDYLCVTTQQLMVTHRPDMPVELPLCESVSDNYYVREGLYFTEYDRDKLADVFERAYAKEQQTVNIKCSDASVYEQMYRILLDEQKIFEFIESDGTVAYTDNKEQGILSFWLFEGRY